MSDPTLPVLLAVIPCEYAHRDSLSLRFTLVGTMSHYPIPRSPYQPAHGIGVYVAVTEVSRPVKMEIDVVTPDGTELPGLDWDLPAGDPLHVYELVGALGIIFVAVGLYTIRAKANGSMLGEWRINVFIPRSVP